MKKVINISLRIIMNSLILLLLAIVVTLVMYFYNEKKSVETGIYKQPFLSAYIIVSGSMLPSIEVNDVIINRYVNPKELVVGDIISFRLPNNKQKIITHRVVGIIKKNDIFYYRTKGDNNDQQDNFLVSEVNLIGKTMMNIPKLGYIYLFLNSFWGISFLIIVIAGVYLTTRIYFNIIKTFNENRTRENNNEV